MHDTRLRSQATLPRADRAARPTTWARLASPVVGGLLLLAGCAPPATHPGGASPAQPAASPAAGVPAPAALTPVTIQVPTKGVPFVYFWLAQEQGFFQQ